MGGNVNIDLTTRPSLPARRRRVCDTDSAVAEAGMRAGGRAGRRCDARRRCHRRPSGRRDNGVHSHANNAAKWPCRDSGLVTVARERVHGGYSRSPQLRKVAFQAPKMCQQASMAGLSFWEAPCQIQRGGGDGSDSLFDQIVMNCK